MLNKQPKPTFKGKHHPLLRPQFLWHSTQDNGFHVALFSGREMTILDMADDEKPKFRLEYLDVYYPDLFDSVDAAKKYAPEFAKTVLQMMIDMIDCQKNK